MAVGKTRPLEPVKSKIQIISGLGLFNKIGSNIILNLGTDVISVYIFLQFLNGIPRECHTPLS